MSSMVNAHRAGSGGLAKLGEGARTTNDSRVSAGLSRGANLGKKLNAAPWSDTFPAAGSTLDLDFANNRGFVRGVGQGGVMDAITFTRASNGTFVNEQGLLVTHANQGALGNNLLQFPQDFENTYWTKTNVTVTANAELAPNGTLTAEQFFEVLNTSNNFFNAQPLIHLANTQFTASIFLKYDSRQYVQFACGSSVNCFGVVVDLINGTISATGTIGTSTYTDSAITNVGNNWFKVSMSGILAAQNTGFIALRSSDASTWTASGLPAITGQKAYFAWGAQLEVGSTATEYFPTNIGQPRFDWASTEQVARRNLLRNTEDFEQAVWNKGLVTVVDNVITAPDGTMTGALVTATSGVGQHRITQAVTASGQLLRSVFVKKATSRYVALAVTTAGVITTDTQTVFDFDTGEFVNGLSLQDPETAVRGYLAPEFIGDGWWRLTVFRDSNYISIINAANSNLVADLSFDGAGEDFYVWGAQCEEGFVLTEYQKNGSAVPSTTPLLANPTSNGLLIEEARTNRLFWNRDATQTEWVKTNVTAAKDQTGIDGVANAASSLTATANDGTCIQTITLVAGNRTGSVFLKRITGTGNIQVTLDGSTYSTVELSDTQWYRIVLSGSVTNPTVGIRLAVSGDAVAMDYGQVEDSLYHTSPILTTSATATRAIDSATINNLSEWINDGVGAIVASCISYVFSNTGLTPTRVFSITNGSNNWVIVERTDSGGAFNRVQCSIRTIIAGTINQNFTFVISGDGLKGGENSVVACNFFPFDLNLVSNFEQTVQNTIPSSYSIRHTGIFALGTMNGTIKRIIYYPKKIRIDGLKELLK